MNKSLKYSIKYNCFVLLLYYYTFPYYYGSWNCRTVILKVIKRKLPPPLRPPSDSPVTERCGMR